MTNSGLPIPSHFHPGRTGKVWKVDYTAVQEAATVWRDRYGLAPARSDECRIGLLLVDVQNTFCVPDFELFVQGETGLGAVDDNRRLCRFLYRNLDRITGIVASLDTHKLFQIFHPLFLVGRNGTHPPPYTQISSIDIESGVWRVNPQACAELGIDEAHGQRHLLHYTRKLEEGGRYAWTIWPFHALEGSVGHSLVSAVEEAIFFHSVARNVEPMLITKGNHALTESYSILGPEVQIGADGEVIASKNHSLISDLTKFDILVVAGQAKSHCVAWTIQDLLASCGPERKDLASKIYLLEDCTSPVVVPGVVDFSEDSAAAFKRFEQQGASIVSSLDPVEEWPGVNA